MPGEDGEYRDELIMTNEINDMMDVVFIIDGFVQLHI